MSRRSLAKIRKSEFAEAAYLSLSKHGLQGTTLQTVADIAGVSKASVLHYFKSKDALLESALRQANTVLLNEAVTLLKIAQTPWERVYAVLQANFSPVSFTPKVAHGWVAMCSEVPHDQRYQRIQNVIYRRNWTNLHSALSRIISADRAEVTTHMIISLIDGLWIRCSLRPDGVSREFALGQFEQLFESSFAGDDQRLLARDRMENVSAILLAGAASVPGKPRL
ncbi:MAG: transcriptional regulator BetI [Paracoccaceae bacterium]